MIKPDSHGVLTLAKDHHITHAGYSLQCVLDVDVQIIRDVLIRKAVIGREESRGKHKVGICLRNGYARVLDFLRKAPLCRRNTVLHVDRRDVQVIPCAEGDIDAAGAVVRTGRRDVMHALDPIDLLLQGSSDRGFHHLRIRANIVAGHSDLRRREGGIQRDGQAGNADRACENYQQRAYCRKNRPFNEKVNQTYTSL